MLVTDTSISGIIMFDKYLNAQIGKDSIIGDERYNGGGRIPDFYTEKLQRLLLTLSAPREGKNEPMLYVVRYRRKRTVVNKLSGSGGAAFPWIVARQHIGH